MPLLHVVDAIVIGMGARRRLQAMQRLVQLGTCLERASVGVVANDAGAR